MPYTPLTREQEKQVWQALLANERIVWRAWLRDFADRFERYEYNVLVGQGSDPGSGYNETLREMWRKLTRKRIDVLAWNGASPTIIEVAELPGLTDMGQLLGYEALWRADHPTATPPRLLFVASRDDADVFAAMRRNGIEINVVVADFSELGDRAR